MTTLGHTLVGATLGILFMPVPAKTVQRALFIAAMIAVASIPDWPIPGWGHDRLAISHSIVVNAVAMLFLAMMLHRLGSGILKQGRVIIGIGAAWMSHFVLDVLYADSRLAVFWPFSPATVALPIPWLKTMPHVPPPFDQTILTIWLCELLTFLPLVFIAVAVRKKNVAPPA